MSEPTITQRGAADRERGAYEPADVNPKAAWLTLGAVIGTVALTCAGVAGLFALFGQLREPTPLSPMPRGAPMLQTDERADRAVIGARTRPKPLRIDQAMRQTASAGWDSTR
jgi:hypothetical protein